MIFNESDMPCISEKYQGDVPMVDKEDVTRLQVEPWSPMNLQALSRLMRKLRMVSIHKRKLRRISKKVELMITH